MTKEGIFAILFSSSASLVLGESPISWTLPLCFFGAVTGAMLRNWQNETKIRDKAPQIFISISIGCTLGVLMAKVPMVIKYLGDNPSEIGLFFSLIIAFCFEELKASSVWAMGFIKDFLTSKFLKK